MKANDDLIKKDQAFKAEYEQIQNDLSANKISEITYVKKLRELHIRLLVHLEDVKNYHDSDSRLTSIKDLEKQTELVKNQANEIVDKLFPKTAEGIKVEKEIKQVINDNENERVIDIFTLQENNSRQLCLKLNNGVIEYVDYDGQFMPLNFSDSAYNVVEELVSKNKTILLEWVNTYKENERDFYFFLYDLSSFAFFASQLPSKFDKLKKMEGNYDELLHNRIIAQLAIQYQNQGESIDYEITNDKEKNPDLHVNEDDLEVKTIISSGINHPDHYVRFSKSIRNRFSDACKQIHQEKDMVAICPWSQIMVNILKEYYNGLYSTKLPLFAGGKTILILEGEKPFEDYYYVVPSDQICNDIRIFAESGYKRLNELSYLRQVRRKGFGVGRRFPAGRGFNMTFRLT